MEEFKENTLKRDRAVFLTIFIIIGISVSLIVGFIEIHKSNNLIGYLFFTIALSGPALLYLLYRSSGNEEYSILIITSVLFIFQIVHFYFKMNDPEHFILFSIYPIFYFFLLGFPRGLYYSAGLLIVFIIEYYFSHGLLNIFELTTIWMLFTVFLINTILFSAHTIEIKNGYQIVFDIADTDYLTSLFNRKAFLPILDNEIKRMKRNKNIQHLTIVMFDIDDFDNITDNYGNQAGDKIQIEFSGLISDWLRKEDTVARWDSKDFIAMFRETDIPDTLHVIEKLKEKIKNHRFEYVNHITCSFGIAEYKSDEQRNELIKRADQALFRARQKSKNSVAVSEG
jgi:diguanylate cyclase (GGDEF)-like protein